MAELKASNYKISVTRHVYASDDIKGKHKGRKVQVPLYRPSSSSTSTSFSSQSCRWRDSKS